MKILLWLGVAIVGIFGVLFAWRKISNRPHDQDIMSSPDEHAPVDPTAVKPDTSAGVSDHDEHAPDWLKEAESPFGSVDILSESQKTPAGDISPQTESQVHTPDWMKDQEHDNTVKEDAGIKLNESVTLSKDESATEIPVSTSVASQSQATSSDSVPDWLRDDHETIAPLSPIPEETEVITPPEPTIETPIPPSPVQPEEKHEDIPDWLRGSDETKENTSREEVKNETSTPTETMEGPVQTTLDEKSQQIPTSTISDDDIPEWLRGTKDTKEESPTPPSISAEPAPTGSTISATQVVTPTNESTEVSKKKRTSGKHWKKKEEKITSETVK